MMRRSMNPRTSGFTLVELMIVVLVASILVGISVPTYQTQIRHSRRTDAKTALLDLAVREEKYLSLYNSYTSAPTALGYSTAFPVAIGNNYYQVYVCPGNVVGTSTTPCTAAATATTGTSFVVSAIPVAGTSQANDSQCQYFQVDNTGTQVSTNSTTGGGTVTTSTCWQ
jgi:type IV pilus assembly protein PilE